MEYSNNFLRDIKWYFKLRHTYNFDGRSSNLKPNHYIFSVSIFKSKHAKNEWEFVQDMSKTSFENAYPNLVTDNGLRQDLKYPIEGIFYDWNFKLNGQNKIIYDKNGIDGIRAFYELDTNGKVFPTKHPNILNSLLITKGCINLHIQMHAEDWATGLFPGLEFRALCIKLKAPHWFMEAVEHQKFKYGIFAN